MDKNKNLIPDWVENVLHWGSVAVLLATTLKKIYSGEDLAKAMDTTSGVENGNSLS